MRTEEFVKAVRDAGKYVNEGSVVVIYGDGSRKEYKNIKQVTCSSNGVMAFEFEDGRERESIQIKKTMSFNGINASDYDVEFYYPQSDGCCYLTTACVEHLGLEDNCYELETLRHFRDTYMKTDVNRLKDVEEYYEVGPRMVDSINLSTDKEKLLADIYKNLVLKSIGHIEAGENETAYNVYKNYVNNLKTEILS